MSKTYNIILDDSKLGTSKLEKADAPMGVVFGVIDFPNIPSGYDFFKNYCLKNKIDFEDYPEDKSLSTLDIPNLHVADLAGVEIKGAGCSISGMDSEAFEVYIVGINYPFYEQEFPHHVSAYNKSL